MLPLVLQLAAIFLYDSCLSLFVNFASVVSVATPSRFFQNGFEVNINGCQRIRVFLESEQLRMIGIAPGFAAEYGTGEQAFAPECRETFDVKVLRVDGPQTHWLTWSQLSIPIRGRSRGYPWACCEGGVPAASCVLRGSPWTSAPDSRRNRTSRAFRMPG